TERVKKRIVVSKVQAGAENTVATLREALQKVKEGDTIALAESPLTEPFIRWPRAAKDVTIESALPGNKPVHIEFTSPGGSASFAMLDFTNCEGVRLKDLDLDGK